ncbi:MAG: TIR domain-containing protein [Thioploca sp.]|nr:TIR domain-containing protein [Thioploca sp.]
MSYSQKDNLWKERFRIHLGFLECQGLVKLWSDQKSLEVGEDWYSAIEQAISQAKIVLLLVSLHFLNSKFVAEREIPRFLERRQQGTLLMYAVICKPCAWKAVDGSVECKSAPNGVNCYRLTSLRKRLKRCWQNSLRRFMTN